jgi:hypothetical protein
MAYKYKYIKIDIETIKTISLPYLRLGNIILVICSVVNIIKCYSKQIISFINLSKINKLLHILSEAKINAKE